METAKLIIQILLAGSGVAILAALRQLIKEIKDVIRLYKEAESDGNIDNDELAQIGSEAIEALITALNFWKLLKKTFSGKFKK